MIVRGAKGNKVQGNLGVVFQNVRDFDPEELWDSVRFLYYLNSGYLTGFAFKPQSCPSENTCGSLIY
jgi:hypothetical protein